MGKALAARSFRPYSRYRSKGASVRIGRKHVLSVGTAIGLVLVMATASGAAMASDDGQTPDGDGDDHHDRAAAQHVLLLSVDGMHQSHLDWYIVAHPDSALAHLVGNGASFSRAQTPVPSDSFPGMVAQVTAGNPSSTTPAAWHIKKDAGLPNLGLRI
jgi:hypothetical protein